MMMITEAEFVAIRAFDDTLIRNTDEAQRIINRKTAELQSFKRRISAQENLIANLTAALAAEKAKSAGMLRQIRNLARA